MSRPTAARDTEGVFASVGKVIRLSEPDYCYGRGPLTIRLELVDRAHPVRYDGDIWYRVEGVQIGSNGTDVGRRDLLVRGSRLPP
jgi:hypothetical protein